jgi:membrane fusion protein, heavy metal efflux system
MIVWIALGVCAVVAVTAMVVSSRSPRSTTAVEASEEAEDDGWHLVAGTTDTLELSPRLVRTLGVRTSEVKRAPSHDRLNLSGSLLLDSNRLVRVHSRFGGEVVSIGMAHTNNSNVPTRPLRLGDHVSKGQLLAVVWSKDVGEKKSDLVNALSKLYMDETMLKSLRRLREGEVPMSRVREAERARESDIIEVDRVERTLRSWRLTEEEIDVVRAEAEKIHNDNIKSDIAVDKSWAEMEVRSPFDGIVLEKNIVPGDIVDTDLDLFKIADLNVLGVMAQVYEEDLPALDALRPDQRRWTIHLQSQVGSPGIEGTFDLIGNIVDPTQHTAAVMGWLDNKDGRLRDGQFITATIELPAADDEVMIPDTALIQNGDDAIVYIARDPSGQQVTRRHVALVSRGQDVAFVRSRPRADDTAHGCKSLEPGEWVVSAGSIELDGALDGALVTASRGEAQQN